MTKKPAVLKKAAMAVFSLMLLAAVLANGIQALSVEKAEYVGTQICVGCHADYDSDMRGTKHDMLFQDKDETGPKKGCESCHGPGSVHLEGPPEGIINFQGKAAEKSRACLNCHVAEDTKNWQVSQHALDGVACTDCHSPHRKTAKTYKGKEKPDTLLVDDKIQLCLSCHEEKIAEINLPSHHPVKEGKVGCNDCHSPHDNSLLSVDRLETKCVNCHQEKAGPFVFEHTPAVDGCLTCHNAHGSINQNLLTLRQPGLCLQCHINTPSAPNGHDSSGAFKTCTNCHVDIHGSNKHNDYCPSVFGCPYP